MDTRRNFQRSQIRYYHVFSAAPQRYIFVICKRRYTAVCSSAVFVLFRMKSGPCLKEHTFVDRIPQPKVPERCRHANGGVMYSYLPPEHVCDHL